MAEIVDFAARRGAPRPTDGAPRGPATIHLFLGVRYERQPDHAPESASPPGAGKREKARSRGRHRRAP